MFTSYDKALTAIVMAVLYFVNNYTGIEIGIDEGVVNAIIVALSPFLVWLIPNKKPA